MKYLVCWALVAAPAAVGSVGGWAHVGNTYNSAIFVHRAILVEPRDIRPFRTLHINVQPAAGWVQAEHRGYVNCEDRTLRYEGVVMTKTDGSREVLPSAVAKPVPFPARGLMRTVALSMCSGELEPAVEDPVVWTKKYFRPG